MKRRHSAAILCAAAVLGACATGMPFRTPESAPADGAHVYVYRPFGLAAAHAHDVVVDGRPPLRLPSSGWVRYDNEGGAAVAFVNEQTPDEIQQRCDFSGIDPPTHERRRQRKDVA